MESRLLRATEELVTATRLEQIAKDNKSIGSILDTRIIQPLDEIKFQTKKAIKVDIENMEEALMQSLMGWAQSIPVLAGQGQDPSKPVLAIVNAIDARRKGKSVTEAISNVFLAEKEEMDISLECRGINYDSYICKFNHTPKLLLPEIVEDYIVQYATVKVVKQSKEPMQDEILELQRLAQEIESLPSGRTATFKFKTRTELF
jgi:hypothetical protein